MTDEYCGKGQIDTFKSCKHYSNLYAQKQALPTTFHVLGFILDFFFNARGCFVCSAKT